MRQPLFCQKAVKLILTALVYFIHFIRSFNL